MKKILKLLVIGICFLNFNLAYGEDVDEEDFANPTHGVGNENSIPNDAHMGEPSFAGNGCPTGTVDAVLSPDKKTLSILFDQFGVTAESTDTQKRFRSSCEIVMPFKVPPGMTVSIVRLDYRGYSYIEKNPATVVYKSSYFLSGLKKNGKMTKLARRKKKFIGPIDEEFYLSSKIKPKKRRKSHCGKDFDFHILSEIIVRRKKSQSEVEAIIDSIDGQSQSSAEYHLNWEKCEEKPKRKRKKNRARKKRNRRASRA